MTISTKPRIQPPTKSLWILPMLVLLWYSPELDSHSRASDLLHPSAILASFWRFQEDQTLNKFLDSQAEKRFCGRLFADGIKVLWTLFGEGLCWK